MTAYSGVPRLVPPNLACPPLFELSLGLSAVPLGLVLLVDASRMLAIVFELPPPGCQPSFKNCPPGGGPVAVLRCTAYSGLPPDVLLLPRQDKCFS